VICLFTIGILLIIVASEAVVILKLLQQQGEAIEPPKQDANEADRAIVEMICSSITDQEEDWTLSNGAMTHKDGLEISITPDGSTICFKRENASGMVGGEDAKRIKAAVLSRNLRKAFLSR
jgi:hypothetical protein